MSTDPTQPAPKWWAPYRPWVIKIAIAVVAALATHYGLPPAAVEVAREVPVPVAQAPAEPAEYSPTQGWHRDEATIAANLDPLTTPQFDVTPAGRVALGDDDVFLWQAVRKVNNRGPPWYPNIDQGPVGCCVGAGWKHCCDVVQATAILGGQAFEWKPASAEVIYGVSRVDVGGGRISGDGSVGAWAAAAVSSKAGIAAMQKYDSDDLTVFSPARARKYGSSGVPADIKGAAKEHPVKSTALVKSWADVKRAIQQGYPVAVCSDQGFTMSRDATGRARPQGTWNHCVPYGTMISTRIPKPCQDVVVGDQVVGHDGQLHPVTQVFARPYEGDMYTFDTYGMVPTKFTAGHPVLVYRRMIAHGANFAPGLALEVYAGGRYASLVDRYAEWEKGNPVWLAAEEVMAGDYLLSPHLKPSVQTVVPDWVTNGQNAVNRPVWPAMPTSDLAWLMGLYIADGHAVAGRRVVITLNKHERESIDRAVRAWASLGLIAQVAEHDTYVRVTVYSSIAADSFREWFGTDSTTKHIPEFLYSGWDTRALVDGITDGDGCAHQGGLVVSTTSNRLALQLHQLLLTHGDRPSMKHQPRNGGEFANAAPGWTVSWAPGVTKPLMRHWGDYYLMPVRNVTVERYAGTVWNYEVADVHSYLANNIVSHNCMSIIAVRTSKEGRAEGGFILNNWGDKAHTGSVWPADAPVAGFWADASVIDRMVKQGDSFALSDVAGFPKRIVPLDWNIRANTRDDFRTRAQDRRVWEPKQVFALAW